MEYKVFIKNKAPKESVISQVLQAGRNNSAGPISNLLNPFSPARCQMQFALPVSSQLQSFAMQLQYETIDYALYFVSGKGGQEFDYYTFDARTLIYYRSIDWSYWATQDLEVTAAQLQAICPVAKMENIAKHIHFLNETMRKYAINTRLRQVHFLSQLAHESAHFAKTLEGGSGQKYEGRVKNLGNTQPGDGPRFKGRGLIQLTGRDAYTQYGNYIKRNLTEGDNMAVVEQEPYASDCSGWFWLKYKGYAKLNNLADKDDFVGVTKGVNGGTNGIEERRRFYNNAKRAFGI